MTTRDWFRKTSWTDADRADFELRLARARRVSRAQYLRIQAGHLAASSHHREAVALLDRMLAEYPDRGQLAMAHLQRAECFDGLNEVTSAVESFRAALETERSYPNALTRAGFVFPLFIARRRLRDLFAEALEVLDSPRTEQEFAIGRFQAAAARALIAADLGDVVAARDHAASALAAASETHSGYSRHPTVGLVGRDDRLLDDMRLLAG